MEEQAMSPEQVKAIENRHETCVESIKTVIMILGMEYDPIDIVFAVGQVLDEMLNQIETQLPEPGKQLRKTIAIAIEEDTHEDVMNRIDKEVYKK